MSRIVVVGSRTTAERGGHGRGLRTFSIDGDGVWSLASTWECPNPSFVAWSPSGTLAYVLHGDGDRLSTVAVLEDGTIAPVAERGLPGINPVHLTLDGSRRWLLVCHHINSVASFPINDDESLGDPAGIIEFDAPLGPHQDQSSPKPHQVVPDPVTGGFLVPLKGSDVVVQIALNPDTGELTEVWRAWLRRGSGPRHLVAARSGMVYVLGELDSTVTVMERVSGGLRAVQVLPTWDIADPRDTRAGDIVADPGERVVYASNRSGSGDRTPGGPGPDTIAAFVVQSDGRLIPVGVYACGGVRPRHFLCLDGDLVVELERSDRIVRMPRAADGSLGRPDVLAETGSPVCVLPR